jgi:2'-hydroxyisoflavone reductase
MRFLILGGTHFAGRAIAEAAVADGIEVTTLNRGRSPLAGPVRTLVADRADPAALRAALGSTEWDAVIDTWSWAPSVVADACAALAGRTGHFGYVSTISVYRDPIPPGAGEDTPTVEADPDDGGDVEGVLGYQKAKRGAELAVLRAFGDAALLARPGLILGRYENVGRLPYWLRRISRGGRVLAPGGPDCPVQYVDVRDMASWMIEMAKRRAGGVYNVVDQPGASTLGQFLTSACEVTGSGAELVWVPEEVIMAEGIEPWTELPLWVPRNQEETVDVSAVFGAGFTARTPRETVADAWAWLQAAGDPQRRPDRPRTGLDPEKEEAVLARLAR